MSNVQVVLNHDTQKFRVVYNGKILGRVDEVERGTVKHPLACADCKSVVQRETPVIRGFSYDSSPEVIQAIGHPSRVTVFEQFLLPEGHA